MPGPTEHKTVQARILAYLRNQGKFFCAEENRELDLTVIDYGDLTCPREQRRNVYEVTEEFYVHNGRYGTREDVVFLINGLPVLVIECKNADKDEAIALGVDQIRRYHEETPEVMVPESFEDRQIKTADALAGLLKEIEKNEQRKKEQAAKGLDGLTYFVLCKLTEDGIPNPDVASRKVAAAFAKFPNWQRSEARKQVTFALFAEEENMDKVTATVEALFTLLQKSFRK